MPYRTQIVGTDAANTLGGTDQDDLIYGYNPASPQVTSISATRVATGLNIPLFAGAPDGDTSRLFVVEKGGLIKVLDLVTGQILAKPFLDVSAQISTDGEEGLLGLAFDPNFWSNGFVYVNLVATDGSTEIRRYQVGANTPNVIDPSSETLILRIPQEPFNNHKGGWLDFGPDGNLYIATGDGGFSNDPNNNAQNIDSLLGKMLRIDVRSDDFPSDPDRNYKIPADNMFVGTAGADEIFATGLRNPWRDSFDRGNGDFYIADVGQGAWEEINIGQKGANYGWRIYEGPVQQTGETPSPGTLTGPIHTYDHSVGRSITGGYAYRGSSDGLQGQYFFADFVTGRISTLRFDGSAWVSTDRTSQIKANVGSIGNVTSFGEDGLGNLYVMDADGDLFRLTPNATSSDRNDILDGFGGADIMYGGAGNDILRGGDGRDELHGGIGGDVLEGGADDDILDGGAGADRMTGGLGNDLYYVDNKDDKVIELADGGIDTVISSVAFRIADHVDILRLAGTANIGGAGSNTANTLIGNSGANVLNGGNGDDRLIGGAGKDTLEGGQGNDTFVFRGSFGNDVIKDFRGNGAALGDVIEIGRGHYADFAAVLAATTDTGKNLVIGSGSNTITLLNVSDVSLLHSSDFVFV